MASRLAFLCHASTAALREARFPDDEPLDAAGQGDSDALRGRLPAFERCWTSPTLRTRQTAMRLGLDAAVEPALRDCDFGRWKAKSLADVTAAEPQAVALWLSDPAAAPHGGESILGVIARTGAWLDGQASARGTWLAITHAAVIRSAIVHALGADATAFWRIDVEPLSLVEFSSNGKRWNLRSPAAMGRTG